MSATTISNSSAASLSNWVERFFDRLETWSYAIRMREVEAYLAQAQDPADLERRMTVLQDARRRSGC